MTLVLRQVRHQKKKKKKKIQNWAKIGSVGLLETRHFFSWPSYPAAIFDRIYFRSAFQSIISWNIFQESLISLNCNVSIMVLMVLCMLARWSSGNGCMGGATTFACKSLECH